MTWTVPVLIAIVALWALSRIKIASESERFAQIARGKLLGLKGPGLLFKAPGSEVAWLRLRVGDRGRLVAPQVGRFHDNELPVKAEHGLPLQTLIQIVGFEDNPSAPRLRVMVDPDGDGRST